MAVTGTKTVEDLTTQALRKARIAGIGEIPASDDSSQAIEELNMMLKGWQNDGLNLWTKTGGSLTLTTAASYTLSPVRPLRILSARFRETATSNEIPMTEMMRDEYDELPNKSTTGTPTQFYYDRQREAALFYIWPILSAATAETVQFTYTREIEDMTSTSDTVDVPGEWWETVVYGLAARLIETYGLQNPNVTQRAEMLYFDALAFDREGSICFGRA